MALMTEKLRAIMAIDPVRAEIDFEGRDYSWGDLARVVHAIEAALDGMNLPAEARVGIMLRNRPGHIAAILAVLSTDRCLVSLNPILPDTKLFADIEGLGLPAIIADESDVARGGIVDAFARAGSAVIAIGARLEGARLLEGHEAPKCEVLTSPGVAIEMLTSGTTGSPKRVPLTRASFDASFAGFTRYERGRDFADQPQLRSGVTMVNNPLTHIGGIYGCIGALAAGRKIGLLEKFTVEGWVESVRRNRPKVAGAVPSAVRMLLEADVDPADISSLSAMISGTAPLAPELVDAFYEKYGIPILANYGATEFAGAIAGWSLDDFKAHWQAKRGAVGRIHSNITARVVDTESGAELPHGAEGLLEMKGDQLGPAYAQGGATWLRTTDRAVVDADGFLFIRGRADNAIIRGGFKVHPDDVVTALHEHPAIREAAVIGVPDERLGAVPAAAIILRDGAEAPEPEALKAFLKDRLIAYQVPAHYRFVADFPRTPSMKPSAPGLQALFAEGDAMTLPRPLPAIDLDNAAFWTGGRNGELLIYRCGDCRYYVHPPVRFCPSCESRSVAPEAVSGRGRIYTYTVNYKQWVPGLPERYVLALVALEEQADVLLPCNVVNCSPDDVAFGMPVQVLFEQHEDLWVPLFEPSEG